MIMTGPEIVAWQHSGILQVDPWEPRNVNPASIDLRLGSKFAVYKKWVYCPQAEERSVARGHMYANNDYFIDTKKSEDFEVMTFDIPDKGIILRPHILYLMHTMERVYVREEAVPILDGKSSIGRLGIVIHLTAGYGDIGFDGQYTLEVSVLHPVRVYAGMRFCQMRFHRTIGTNVDYKERGHYVGDDAEGPVPSKVYMQFKEK